MCICRYINAQLESVYPFEIAQQFQQKSLEPGADLWNLAWNLRNLSRNVTLMVVGYLSWFSVCLFVFNCCVVGCCFFLEGIACFFRFPSSSVFQGWFYGRCKSACYYWLQRTMPVCTRDPALFCKLGHCAMTISWGICTGQCSAEAFLQLHCCMLHEACATAVAKRHLLA